MNSFLINYNKWGNIYTNYVKKKILHQKCNSKNPNKLQSFMIMLMIMTQIQLNKSLLQKKNST